MLRAGTFRLMFQRLLDLSIVIFRCRSTRSKGSQGGVCTGCRSFGQALAEWSCRTREICLRCGMRRRHRLWPGSHGWSHQTWAHTRAGRPVRSGKMACGSRAARSRMRWRSDHQRHQRWPCQRKRLNLRFRHRLESSTCFCYQRNRSPDNDHLPSLGLAFREHYNIRVVDGHHFVAANFDGQLLHVEATQVLNHSPVGTYAGQRDRGGQPHGPGDNHIVFAKVGEPDKQLLVLVDAARIVGDDHRLPHSFDTHSRQRTLKRRTSWDNPDDDWWSANRYRVGHPNDISQKLFLGVKSRPRL